MEDAGDNATARRAADRLITAIAAYMTEVREGRAETIYIPRAVYGILMIAYALLLTATAQGLFKRKDWGWRLGMTTAAISAAFAVLGGLRGAWGAAVVDGAAAAVTRGALLWVRRA